MLFYVGIVLIITTSVGQIFDLEIQIAKYNVRADILIDLVVENCENGYLVYCKLLLDNKDQIETLTGYDYIFLDYDKFKKQYLKSNEIQKYINENNPDYQELIKI